MCVAVFMVTVVIKSVQHISVMCLFIEHKYVYSD